MNEQETSENGPDEDELASTFVNFEQTIVNFSAEEAPSLREVSVIESGYVFLERYRVKDELGKGAMGIVYLCEDEVAGIDVALKAIPPEIANDRVEMESVRENFQIVYKLHHPNIANVSTLELDHNTGDYYLIMECVPGVNLWEHYKSKGFNPSLSMIIPTLTQIASALDYAHKQSIIHRDIKPSNIQIMEDGTVKILDYGLAQQIQSSMMRVTGHGYSKGGTPFYMAPEQWKGTHQDGTTDQYALAVVIYQVVSGKCPFQSSDMAILREMVLNEKPVKPNELTDIEWKVLRKGLEKERIARFKSCEELVERLQKAASMTASTPDEVLDARHGSAKQSDSSQKRFTHKNTRSKAERRKQRAARKRNKLRKQIWPEPDRKALVGGAVLLPLLGLWLITGAFFGWKYLLLQHEQKEKAYSEFVAESEAALKGRDWENLKKNAQNALDTGWHNNENAKKHLLIADRFLRPQGGAEKIFEINNETTITACWVPVGLFTRGSFFIGHYDEEPPHRVIMRTGFWMGKYEVTQAQWSSTMGHNPSLVRGDSLPVDNVRWEDAVTFCELLSKRLDRTVRLPTEAEWEYACRAGKRTRFFFGNEQSELFKFANFCDAANRSGYAWQVFDKNDGYDKVAPVGSFAPNDWNLHDMVGNVSEWCSDFYGPYPDIQQVDNPKGPDFGERRVLRGGSWASAGEYCRSAARTDFLLPRPPSGSVGFRVVIEIALE